MYNVLDDNNPNMVLGTLIKNLLIVSNHYMKSEYVIAHISYCPKYMTCLDFSIKEQDRSTVSAAAEGRALLVPIRFQSCHYSSIL